MTVEAFFNQHGYSLTPSTKARKRSVEDLTESGTALRDSMKGAACSKVGSICLEGMQQHMHHQDAHGLNSCVQSVNETNASCMSHLL